MTAEQKSAVAIVDRISALVKTPEQWTTGAYARNRKNRKVEINSSAACRFCLWGAVERVIDEMRPASYDSCFVRSVILCLVKDRGFLNIPSFNDSPGTTHADVLKLLVRVREDVCR